MSGLKLKSPLSAIWLFVLSFLFYSMAPLANTVSLNFHDSTGKAQPDCPGAGLFRGEGGFYAFIPDRCVNHDTEVSLGSLSSLINKDLDLVVHNKTQGWRIYQYIPDIQDDITEVPFASVNAEGFSEYSGEPLPRLVFEPYLHGVAFLAAYQAQGVNGQVVTLPLSFNDSDRHKRQAVDCSNDIQSLSSTGVTLLDLSGYLGSGANPGGMNGALNTCTWNVRAGSDSAFTVPFGATATAPDSDPQRLNLGETDGTGERVGGLYSYLDTAAQQRAIWVQPLVNLLTPGALIARVRNTVEPALQQFQVRFRFYSLHNAGFPIAVQFGVSSGPMPAMMVTPLRTLETTTAPASQCHVVTVDNRNIASGENINLHWRIDDLDMIENPPNERRDEFGIGSIELALSFDDDQGCIESTMATPTTVTPPMGNATESVSATTLPDVVMPTSAMAENVVATSSSASPATLSSMAGEIMFSTSSTMSPSPTNTPPTRTPGATATGANSGSAGLSTTWSTVIFAVSSILLLLTN